MYEENILEMSSCAVIITSLDPQQSCRDRGRRQEVKELRSFESAVKNELKHTKTSSSSLFSMNLQIRKHFHVKVTV